ncbi:MAG: type II secretion system F family protein [Candidatus Omnitrophica bacterium]|nr:type II secretion system F family protein [Candidatus Omnitrophota bacterium]
MNIFCVRNLMIFYREFASLITSGIDVIEATRLLTRAASSALLKNAAGRIREDLIRGTRLSEAMRRHARLFPLWHIHLIHYSEHAGKLGEGLESIADYLEKEYDNQKKLIIGLAYPVFLLHATIFLLPLPALFTGCLAAYILGVLHYLVPVYLVLFLLYALKQMLVFPAVKKPYDAVILFVPVFGSLIKRINIIRFIRALKCLHDAGVAITLAWKTAIELCDNTRLRNRLLTGLRAIEAGLPLEEAFRRSTIFPPKVLSMVAVAEKSGSVGSMLDKMAQYGEKENEVVMGILLTTMPVVFYLFVAGFIAYKVITFYTEYFSKISSMYTM